ncbi:integrase, partial [Streptomyces sp. A30]|uniref:integrase n=1 Tax=Streptomyces sp. A30 TaxID=2789273 RepID=UPI0039811BBF
LVYLALWFNYLTGCGINRLAEVTQEMCVRHLEEQSWSAPSQGLRRRRLDPESVTIVVRTVQVITLYSELLSTDAYPAGFVPWDGRPAAAVTGVKARGENAVQPVPDELLQPLLATCLYLVEVVGPHLAEVVEARRAHEEIRAKGPVARIADVPRLKELCEEFRERGEPLPKVSANQIVRYTDRRGDPLRPLAWRHLVSLAGFREITDTAKPHLIPVLVEVAQDVGFTGPWARTAPTVPRYGDAEPIEWTAPLAADDLRTAVGNMLTACAVVTSALSGMRSSELLELEVGCRTPGQAVADGSRRFRLSGKVIKNKRFGGVPDEWVVIEQVDRAIAVAERLVGRPRGEALFGNVEFTVRVRTLRAWLERTGLRAHWGLPEIPAGPCGSRMLRRTLALSIAKRPGGLLAAKVGLKHISVATTEGYAARPGGSQRLFHAEVEAAEEAEHLELTVRAFRDAQVGIMPAGPGARGLIDAFTHIDTALKDAARTDPKILHDDRHLENLLRKLAGTLHVGPANFCWFRDPAKALCLRLAGTPEAKTPLVGMCDSARCPQATHHPCHRPVWAGQAQSIDAFIASPRIAKGEKQRLMPERERALRVIAAIDAAAVPDGRS